ncbi:discoidin domain-containing protein [Cellulosimicrobium cellulans]|uniref:discoidin domain-containing protein n=1 Tax=Cellulosimicrobium cellulans TaxID=1710 RepID=UPI0024055E3F|nr:discoidin domain-containing protein [Cellulosimicrobium cellulans]
MTAAAAVAALAATSGAVAAAPAGAEEPTNQAPLVVPSLREWTGGTGDFHLADGTRVVVPDELADLGDQLAGEIVELTAHDVSVAVDGTPRPGDLVLVLDPAFEHEPGGERFAEEGYALDVDPDVLTVTAPTRTGVYYGTRSVLQVLVQDDARSAVPVGESLDWPDYETRGFMLDVGRRFFTPEFVRDYIAMMGWFKLNEFQIHLMDNEISPAGGDWSAAYDGFRLASDDPAFAGLASEDGAYDRADWQSFEDAAAAHGVQIVPEIEGPAHARSVIRWKPEVGLNGGNSDHLDLAKPETTATMKAIYDEFVPWFEGSDVHMGVDEYFASPTLFRDYFNTMAAHVRDLGKHPRAWGSFTQMQGDAQGYDRDVTINTWNNGWYSGASAVADGYDFVNTNDGTHYVVPFADYYHGNGLDDQWIYESWLPHMAGNVTVAPGAPRGAMFAVWNDLVHADYTERDVHGLVELSFPAMAQKTWAARTPGLPFSGFSALTRTLGIGPGIDVVEFTRGAQRPGELSHGADVAASSADDGHGAELLTDGQTATRWTTSATDPTTLTVDLGAPQRVGAVEVEWTRAHAASYDVETSVDGTTWTRVARHAVAGPGDDRVDLPGGEARWVRLATVVPATDRGLGAWRLSVLGRPDLARGGAVTASGTESGTAFVPTNAVDGDPSTRWSADYSAQPWIAVDLGAERTVDELTLRWEAASATAYRVDTSLDGATWTTAASRTGLAAEARTDVVTVDPAVARHVRVTVTGKAMTPYLSLYDLEVRGATGGAEVDAEAVVRCMAGTAYVAVVVRPTVTSDVEITTAVGARSFSGVGEGRAAYAAFATRSASAEAGVARVSVTAVDGGVTTADVPYAATTC